MGFFLILILLPVLIIIGSEVNDNWNGLDQFKPIQWAKLEWMVVHTLAEDSNSQYVLSLKPQLLSSAILYTVQCTPGRIQPTGLPTPNHQFQPILCH